MYPFLETIRLQKGYMTPWEDHQQRVDRTFQHFGAKPSLQVRTVLSGLDLPDGQIYKVSVWYSLEGDTHIKWQPYQVRSIRTIKLMPLPEVDYSFKFADRGWINELVTQAGSPLFNRYLPERIGSGYCARAGSARKIYISKIWAGFRRCDGSMR
jgi:hypothetical protein